MGEQELKEVIERAKNGDTEAKEIIINFSMKYIKNAANRFHLNNKKLSVDDLVQDGVIAVLVAINYYDMKHDVKFSTYVYEIINLTILNSIKKRHMTVRVPQGVLIHNSFDILSLDENINKVETLLDKIKYKENKFDYIDDYAKWQSIFEKNLTQLEEKVILKFYFENKTIDCIAHELNVDKRKVYVLKHKALKKLKKLKRYYEEEF
ncbi:MULTISPECIES: sigma-70 family RNA polymerase sigma factor [Clostridium]|uniref:sigma-70 family RNA polymerase sigma factor n=1 Tax=Clostridium TaxID=1485 RepID=UPI000825C4F6|nr:MULTISPECIES: sigma-70 family RNA polymerase sigma factor [Clostridium]PJI06591.1 hypothetical protein CUB90_01350 [Clostridium sp. CT7]